MNRILVSLGLLGVCGWPSQARAEIEVQGRAVEVVDMHLHSGHFATMAAPGKEFLLGTLPTFVKPYAPSLLQAILDPYGPHIGIREQTRMAGIDHAVLYAVYTHHTSGYFTNRELESVLLDPANQTDGELPWAWGFASINLDDLGDELLFEDRLDAMASYLQAHPELFVGIKLAHAHQNVALDDPRHLAIYDVAAEASVPVLLHTGFSPFPNSQTEPSYYDPIHLESVIMNHSGTGENRVDFVLAHTGQGDQRSIDHALMLAETYDNVWLEVSALGRPLLRDENGDPVDDDSDQYPAVLAEIAARELTSRTLFGTDGTQSSGYVRQYLGEIVGGMEDAGFTVDQIEAVLSGNFYALFLKS